MVPSTFLLHVILTHHSHPNFRLHQHRRYNFDPNLVIHLPNPLLKVTHHPLQPLHPYPATLASLHHRAHPGLWQIPPRIQQPLILYQTGFGFGVFVVDFWMDFNALQ